MSRPTKASSSARFDARGEAKRARPRFRPPANICSIEITRGLTGGRVVMHYAEVEEDVGIG
jgi:hypothetical protein